MFTNVFLSSGRITPNPEFGLLGVKLTGNALAFADSEFPGAGFLPTGNTAVIHPFEGQEEAPVQGRSKNLSVGSRLSCWKLEAATSEFLRSVKKCFGNTAFRERRLQPSMKRRSPWLSVVLWRMITSYYRNLSSWEFMSGLLRVRLELG